MQIFLKLSPSPGNVGLLPLVLTRVRENSFRGGPDRSGPLSFDSEDKTWSLERICQTTPWVYVIIPLLSHLCDEILSARHYTFLLFLWWLIYRRRFHCLVCRDRFSTSEGSGTFSLCGQAEAPELQRCGSSMKKWHVLTGQAGCQSHPYESVFLVSKEAIFQTKILKIGIICWLKPDDPSQKMCCAAKLSHEKKKKKITRMFDSFPETSEISIILSFWVQRKRCEGQVCETDF